jgi:hypothetical protein
VAFARPLAVFGVVLFTVLFFATAFADPKDSRHFSAAPFAVIAILGAMSTAYVLLVVPRLQRAASARTAAARPTRRPVRSSSVTSEASPASDESAS